MPDYELIIERMNPCGGAEYASREISEVCAESPEAYVREHSDMPVIGVVPLPGGVCVRTGDGKGYVVSYTFTE